jgi:signal transduction histidine kinase
MINKQFIETIETREIDETDYLGTLLTLGRLMNSSLDLKQVLETAIEQVIRFVGAERGFILLVEIETGRVWGEALRNIEKTILEATLSGELTDGSAAISKTLVDQVLETRQPIVSMNAMEDPRFAGRQSVQFHNLRSVLCVPLLAQGRLLGIIYLDNRLKSGAFTDRHLAMLTAFAHQAAGAIDNARLYANLQHSLETQLRLQAELHRHETQELALEEASRLKSEFIGFVAHELRNPLTTIRGYVQTLMADTEHTLTAEIEQEFYEAIEADSDRLLDLINELLDVSRLEAGRPLSLVLKPIMLRPLLDRATRHHRFYKYFTQSHHIVTDIAPDLPDIIVADEDKLNQILANLLGNAIKYSPAGGTVRVVALPEGPAAIMIRVQDEGVGLTPEQCSQLFQRYERIERDDIRNIPGTGLGLFLVKNLVELHGGEIAVESEPGKGSVFIVRLPIEAQQPA